MTSRSDKLSDVLSPQKYNKLQRLSVDVETTLVAAFQKMDVEDVRLLCVRKDGRYFGILSAGDIQRAIISNRGLETPIHEILREQTRVAQESDSFKSIREMMLKFRTEFMPVLNTDAHLVDVFFWDEVFQTDNPDRAQVDVPVVIMAGGKGTRLKPFSNILPKPLFPLGDRTILEVLIDRFRHIGCQSFYLSVNYRAEFIRNYVEQIGYSSCDVQFVEEDEPLGTAGSLHLVRDRIQDTFIVSNCDIIIETDYRDIIEFHAEHQNEITLVAALKHIQIPYGTVQTGPDGRLRQIQEKPEFSFLCNTGLYVLEPSVLQEIPENQFLHITDLIERVTSRGGNVGVYPVRDQNWHDIGQWDEYHQALRSLGLDSIQQGATSEY